MAPAEPTIYGVEAWGGKSMTIAGSRAGSYFQPMRIAGAQVRKFLVAAAAEEWGVDAAKLRTENSNVVDPATGRRLTYGEIASFAKVPDELPAVESTNSRRVSIFG